MQTALDIPQPQKSTQPRRLHVVFYSHPWAVYALKGSRFGDRGSTLVVEMSPRSRIAAVFDAQNRPRFGLPGLLADQDRINIVGDSFKGLELPLALSPYPPSSVELMTAAASLLPGIDSPFQQYLLLLPVDEAPQFRRLYPYCDRFTVLWDLADPPSADLPGVAKSISQAGCWSAETWGGFLWYSHPSRNVPDVGRRMGLIREAMGLTTRAVTQQ